MPKTWNQVAEVLKPLGVSVEDPKSENQVTVIRALTRVFTLPKMIFSETGRVVVHGFTLNARVFALKLLGRIESKPGLSEDDYFRATMSVAHRMANKQQAKQLRMVEKKTGLQYADQLVFANSSASVFYHTPEWVALRYRALERYGNLCFACGRGPKSGVIIHVDHIKPRSLHPNLAFDIENLQILCEDCNKGKSNKFQKDWRAS